MKNYANSKIKLFIYYPFLFFKLLLVVYDVNFTRIICVNGAITNFLEEEKKCKYVIEKLETLISSNPGLGNHHES